jgi:hypothetical protein
MIFVEVRMLLISYYSGITVTEYDDVINNIDYK